MKPRLLRLFAGTALLAFSATLAQAADLPAQRMVAPAPVFTPVPVFTWTGFYAGVNAGAAWLDKNDQSVAIGPGPGIPPGLTGTLNLNNNDDAFFTGGGQIGFNWQTGSLVLGGEADIQYADTDENIDAVFVPGPGFAPGATFVPGVFESNAPDWWGSVRLRAGLAFGRLLIYGTGGLAYSDDTTGWAAGGGVEWALPPDWNLFGSNAVTLGVEGLFLSFNGDNNNNNNNSVGTFTPTAGVATPVTAQVFANDDLDFWVVRAKLNFKFNTY